MNNNNFFSRIKPNSAKKISIINDYFDYWLKNNMSAKELYYIDLFCGPGVYDNGEKSTPILILERILKNKKTAGKFNVFLNDKNKNYMKKLENKIIHMENIAQLKSITFSCKEIGKENPTLDTKNNHAFVIFDPWGYKGISSEQINSLIKNQNLELIFLFSFNQLYRFIRFKGIDQQLLNLFSKKSLKEIRNKIVNIQNKEVFLLEKFIKNINSGKCNYLCYKFKFESQNKTSHFLIFLNHDNTAKSALLSIFIKKDYDSIIENIDWKRFIPDFKDVNCSCFVLRFMLKYISNCFKRLGNVINHRMDGSKLESDNRLR